MAEFNCTVCGKAFSLPEATLEKFPGWVPKRCRACSPKKGGSGGGRRRPGGAARATGTGAGGGAAARPAFEENLRLEEVLGRYHGGPSTGVFTDGACSPNPGPGGWGVVWVRDGEVLEQRHGHDPATTNNRMELLAIVHALELLPADAEETLFTDSMLCVNTLESWAKGWEQNGWRRKAGPIKNLELVQRAYALRRARPDVRLAHIAAHAGNRWNEYADSLATAWMRDAL